ncbi:predicted protein [Coccidioides posadasii str. Silveira]|uniref:Predicted protein n=2 Tax=Coccidioides posadasii TaxID=199306 RepID=E9CZK8_COCPS|nr:predicted protein [Coccidioides posadasii str. Silveira]KMM73322.1 hypothetical protein CPAG_09611 [Coccidioides posadasii RMSCC 3488]
MVNKFADPSENTGNKLHYFSECGVWSQGFVSTSHVHTSPLLRLNSHHWSRFDDSLPKFGLIQKFSVSAVLHCFYSDRDPDGDKRGFPDHVVWGGNQVAAGWNLR